MAMRSTGLKQKIALCLGRDRHRFTRRLKRAKDETDRRTLEQAIDESISRREDRAGLSPRLKFPADLPITDRRQEIAATIAQHPVTIVCGETGSGKTTQLPKICLELGRGVDGLIGHTQPRRLAARAVATRIAEEMSCGLGEHVGFQTRFQKRLSDVNLIKVMTDGILLSEVQRDRWLNQYDTIIVDEAHERSLNIDFLLGYLSQLVRKRRDLKLIITSATLDVERIAAHFDSAPVITVEGRTYPVEIRYSPLQRAEEDVDDVDLNAAIHDAVLELQQSGRGDVLVFLPGEREIREASKSLRMLRERFDIHALYSRLSSAEQQRIFTQAAKPRIILSTNVAETSLTVPGIRYVVDAGTARISRYSWRAQIQRLPIEKISRASAQQRAGRCGRVAPGVCIRLFSEEDYLAREEFTQPEIQRTNLAAVILQMASIGLGEVANFPFIDAPDARLVRDGYRLLTELQAVTGDKQLTSIGKQLARLPIDPRLARMLLAADDYGSVQEVLIIVTALAVQDPRDRPYDRRQAADEQHQRFNDKRSDFASLLNLWRYLDEQAEMLSQSALRRLCRREFINHRRWREWCDLYRQLKTVLRDMKLNMNASGANYDAVHRALLCGLLDHLGCKDEKGAYTGSRSRKFYPFPGSVVRAKAPKWVMAAEITETTRVYARTIAGISPQWVEHHAQHLLKRHYSEPHWQKKRARVGGYEKLTLNGLLINPRRPIDFSKVDPALAREIFIREALVYGQWDSGIKRIGENQSLIRAVENLEERTRRRDILIHEDRLFEFFDARLPADVCSGASFSRWFRKADDDWALRLTEKDLVRDDAPAVDAPSYPSVWRDGALEFPLTYKFQPGAEDDGITLTVPVRLLGRIDPQRIEWLVPGFLQQKLVALIRALPKHLRKNFIPVPDFARAVHEAVTPYQDCMYTTLTETLLRMTGVEVPRTAWRTEIDAHLRMRIAVRGDGGKIIAAGRDLESLLAIVAGEADSRAPTPSQAAYERSEVVGWECGPIPRQLQCEEDGYTIERFPAFVDAGEKISLRLFDDENQARKEMRGGVRRMLAAELKQDIRYLNKNLTELQRACLLFSPVGSADSLKEDLYLAAIDRCFFDAEDVPRSEQAFKEILVRRRGDFVQTATTLTAQLATALSSYAAIRGQLTQELPLSWIEAARDIEGQLASIVYPGFILATPAKWFDRLPRYLKAIEIRLAKLTAAPDRDRLRRSEIEPLFVRIQQSSSPQQAHTDDFIQYKWLLEELRISLFAQELGALEKVSVKRLDQLWRNIA